VGLEPTIPVFEQAKTIHALDRAATVIGLVYVILINKIKLKSKLQIYIIFEACKFNVCYGPFSKIAAPPRIAQANQLLLRRPHGLRTCAPGLEGTLNPKIDFHVHKSLPLALTLRQINPVHMYVCMYKGWAFTALAPRPTVVYCA
jgi:hypothetical protein